MKIVIAVVVVVILAVGGAVIAVRIQGARESEAAQKQAEHAAWQKANGDTLLEKWADDDKARAAKRDQENADTMRAIQNRKALATMGN